MQALLFYLTYPFIFFIGNIPIGMMFWISDGLCYLLKLSGYRKEVVMTNLQNSFPDKTDTEIKKLCDAYYRYLCDLILETIRAVWMDEKESAMRCTFKGTEFLDRFKKENRSIILVLGHYGNWEWAGPGFQLNSGFPLTVIYRPLTNPYFDKMMVGSRTRFNTTIDPVMQTLRGMVARRGSLSATAFIADQAAPAEQSHWMEFLHQDTSVFTGPEKLAVKFKYPVVYLHISRPRRGFYELSFELITDDPSKTGENEISEAFMRKLERDIIANPVPWLWSHKRWKNKRPK